MNGAAKWVAAALCAYEVAAIASGRVPTLTQACTRWRLLGPALVLALAVHLFRQPRPVRVAAVVEVTVPAGPPMAGGVPQ